MIILKTFDDTWFLSKKSGHEKERFSLEKRRIFPLALAENQSGGRSEIVLPKKMTFCENDVMNPYFIVLTEGF